MILVPLRGIILPALLLLVLRQAPIANRLTGRNWTSFVALIRGRRADVAPPNAQPSTPTAIARVEPTPSTPVLPVEVEGAVPRSAKLVLLAKDGELDHALLGSAAGKHRGDPRDFADAVADALGGDWFPTKLVGVTHRNNDRTSRQNTIKRLESLDSLDLVPEPTNPYDPNASRVIGGYFAKDYEWIDRQIGYLDSRLAGQTTRAMKRESAISVSCWTSPAKTSSIAE